MNLKAEHTGQGDLNLYRMGSNVYLDIFPLLEWSAINGILVEHDIELEPCVQGGFQHHNTMFVGGVSGGHRRT